MLASLLKEKDTGMTLKHPSVAFPRDPDRVVSVPKMLLMQISVARSISCVILRPPNVDLFCVVGGPRMLFRCPVAFKPCWKAPVISIIANEHGTPQYHSSCFAPPGHSAAQKWP